MGVRPRQLYHFLRGEAGSVFAETVIVLPVIIILSAGILEFGNILWQRHQLQTGVRDAARYWSRCPETYTTCTEEIAENIAFYGTPTPDTNTPPRVPGWNDPADLIIDPDSPADPEYFTVIGRADYVASPLFNLLELESPIGFSYYYQTRYFGW